MQQRFPDFRFRLAGPVDAHHDQLRFSWELGPAGAPEAPIAGSDVAVRDGAGRLVSVFGFLDRVPAHRPRTTGTTAHRSPSPPPVHSSRRLSSATTRNQRYP